MIRPFAALIIAVGLVAAAVSWGDSPKLNSSNVFGARRGEPTEVTFLGLNLEAKARLIAPFAAEVVTIGADPASWKVRITPAIDTPVGVYLVRVRTEDGLSNPFLFAVGQVAQVAEKEDNGTFDTAQGIASPSVVEGTSEGNDVDFFRFAGKKGQRIVVDAQCARIGSGIDPSIRLSTASHAYVASADDTPGLATDARLTVVLPEDTDYVIELSDSRYQGAARAIYRLLVGPVPVAEEVFPLGGRTGETIGLELRGGTLPGPRIASATLKPSSEGDLPVFRPRITNQMLEAIGPGEAVLDLESMPPLAVSDYPELREPSTPGAPPIRAVAPVVFNGRIAAKGETDRYALVVVPGQKLHIAVEAAELGSALDGVLQIKGPDGAVLASADDTAVPVRGKGKGLVAAKKAVAVNSPDPSVNFTVPAGMTEITLNLRDLRGEGGAGFPYRMTVEPIAPGTFELASVEDQISIPKGGTAAVSVEVVRQGYDGVITLTVADIPPGLVVRPGRINPGQTVGALTISSTPEASIEITRLKLVGQGQGSILVNARKPLIFSQQGALTTNAIVQEGLPASTASPTPITLNAPTPAIEIVPGYGASLPVQAIRSAGTEDAVLTFGSLPLPNGLTVAPSNIPAKATEGMAILNAPPETPIAPQVVALTVKTSIGGKERLIAVPAITLEVVRPASIELSSPTVDIKAGETVEFKGKVARKGPFKEPVTVKLEPLPAGVKADPVVVPPEGSDFTIKLIADPKAAAGMGVAQAILAFQVAKKDYPVPTAPLTVKVIPVP